MIIQITLNNINATGRRETKIFYVFNIITTNIILYTANIMSDWIAPVTLALLAIFMYFVVNILEGIVEEEKRNEQANTQYSKPPPKNRPNYMNTTIVDNFLGSEDTMLKALKDKSIWTECDQGVPQWWDGKTEPKNLWEELSKKIWMSRPEYAEAVGFEYWCNILTPIKKLYWHIDKDEEAMQDSFELITPLFGAVYYGFDHDGLFDGGKLWLVDAEIGDSVTQYESEWRDELTEVDAKYNRLIYFNASLWHRVSDVTRGARYTFAVNAMHSLPTRLHDKKKKY